MQITRVVYLLIPISIFSCSAQEKPSDSKYFEGVVTYKIEFKTLSDKYDSSLLAMAIGKNSEYYFKNGNYLIKNDDAITYENLYRVDENKSYSKRVISDSILWADCSQPGFAIKDFMITLKKEMVLGVLCDELKVYFADKMVTNYYNDDTIRIDPAWHKKYTFYNQDFYSDKMKSLALKFIIEKKDYTVTYTATSFITKKLDDKLFEVPTGQVLVEEK